MSKKKVSKKKASAKKGTALATTAAAGLPAGLSAEDFGAGFEETNADSFAIPFLRILQQNSPQCNEDMGEYIEGARPGMFFNSVTMETFAGREGGVQFVPCHFEQRFLHWGPRGGGGDGGGLKGVYSPAEASELIDSGKVQLVKNRYYFPDHDGSVHDKCDRLSDTRSHYGLLIVEGQAFPERVILALSSTQIKKSKQMMAALGNRRVKLEGGQMVQLPTYSALLTLMTTPESNDDGTWSGLRIDEIANIEDPELIAEARKFYNECASGAVKANYDKAENDAGGRGGAVVDDEEVF